MKAHDALADDVHAFSGIEPPSAVVLAVLAAVAQRGDVVGQGVPPDVDHLVGVARNGDPPAAGSRGRPGDTDVGQAGSDEREDLVAAFSGFDPDPPGLQRLQNLVGVAGEPKEPVVLGDRLGRRLVLRAHAVDEFICGVELFAARAVQAFVAASVEVALGDAGLPQPLDAAGMAGVAAGTDEVIERQRQRRTQCGETVRVCVHKLPDADSRGTSGGDVLQRVVVRAGQEPDRPAPAASVPCEYVGLHQFQRMPPGSASPTTSCSTPSGRHRVTTPDVDRRACRRSGQVPIAAVAATGTILGPP